MSRRRFTTDPRPRRDPEAADAPPNRQTCSCGCPDALVMFRLPLCHNPQCKHFDAGFPFSGPEGRRKVEIWARGRG